MEWINVEDRTPNINETVLVWCHNGYIFIAALCWIFDEFCYIANAVDIEERYKTTVTHWMPLPEPPK